jgi:hypothetical protein
LAKVVSGVQFLQQHQLSPLLGRCANTGFAFSQALSFIGPRRLLDEPYG